MSCHLLVVCDQFFFSVEAHQGRIQLVSKVGVHIRHTMTRGVGGHALPPGKKLIFGKNIVHFL